jgi:hypothetical protein
MRCGASNVCPYCAWLTAVENSLVLGIDARERQPTVGFTLTTHRQDFDRQRFTRCVGWLFEEVRKRYGSHVAYCMLIEWSTGRGGHGRLLHGHGLLKGLNAAAITTCAAERKRSRCGVCDECWMSNLWEALTDGAWRVELRELRTAGGAIAYTAGHHHKREQAPPPNMRGVKRMRPSQRYFERPIGELREEARGTIAAKSSQRAALAALVGADLDDSERSDVLEALLAREEGRPPPRAAKIRQDGAVVALSDGAVLEAGAAARG